MKLHFENNHRFAAKVLTLNFDIHTHTHLQQLQTRTAAYAISFHHTTLASIHTQTLAATTDSHSRYTIAFRKFIVALWPYIQNNFGLKKPQARTSQLYHSLRYMFKILSRVGRVMYNPTFQHKFVLYTSATQPFNYSTRYNFPRRHGGKLY